MHPKIHVGPQGRVAKTILRKNETGGVTFSDFKHRACSQRAGSSRPSRLFLGVSFFLLHLHMNLFSSLLFLELHCPRRGMQRVSVHGSGSCYSTALGSCLGQFSGGDCGFLCMESCRQQKVLVSLLPAQSGAVVSLWPSALAGAPALC